MLRHNTCLALATALLLLVAGSFGDHHCNENDDENYIRPGKVHRYKYTAETETGSGGTTDKVTGIKIECTMEVASQKGCEYSLKTSDCNLYDIPSPGAKGQQKRHPKSADFGQQLAKNTIVFAMHEGHIDEVRAPVSETPLALNIKRAMISGLMLKKTSSDDYENRADVMGTCPVKYTASGDKVTMEKDVKHCRFPSKPDFQLSPYSLFWNQSFGQYILIKSQQSCDWALEGNQLKSGQCTERHAIKLSRPDADDSIAVYTNVIQSFELRGSARVPEKVDAAAFRKTGIEYEFVQTPEPTQAPAGFPQSAFDILKNLVESSNNDIRLHSIKLFGDLIELLRQAPDVLTFTQTAYEQGETDVQKHLNQAFVRDALVQCHTIPCIKALKYLAVNNKLTDRYVYHILLTFTKLKVHNPSYIQEILDIVKAKPSRAAFLGLSTSVHKFLRSHPEHANAQPVKNTVEYFSNIIGENCDHNSVSGVTDINEDYEKQEMVILTLKSIGNLGDVAQKVNSQLTRKLYNCATNDKLAHNTTLEAVRAFRKFEPTTYNYGRLMNIAQNNNMDMENRVAAFGILANHWQDANTVEEFVKIAQKEEGQMHNYIVTYLKSVSLEDEDEYKELARNARAAIAKHPEIFSKLPALLPASRHKEFSRHRHVGFLPEGENEFGYHAKTDLLWEDDSYLPSGLLVNLTSHLFGKDVNFMELGASVHGVDKIAEAYFGPNGVFRGMNAQEVVAHIKSLGMEIISKLQGADEEEAAAAGEIPKKAKFNDAILAAIDKIQKQITFAYKDEETHGALDLKIFGNTVAYTSLDLIKSKLSDLAQDFFAGLQWEQQDWQRTRVVKFIEATHPVPTFAGVPLVWDTESTLAYSIRAGSQGDFTGLLHEEKSFSAEYYFRPSAALELDLKTVIKVDGFTEAGFQTNTSFFHSSHMAGNVNLENGQFKLVRKISGKPVEVLTFTRVNQFVRGNAVEDIPDWQADRANHDWCAEKILLPVTGIKLCRHKSYVSTAGRKDKPYTLLAGNIDYRITAEVADKGIKEYAITIQKEAKGDGVFEYNGKMEAVGSSTQRELNIKHTRRPESREFHLQVSVPSQPHVKIDIERKQLKEGGLAAGYETEGEISIIAGRTWKFGGRRHNSTEAKGDKMVRKSDKMFHLNTPWSAYEYKSNHESVFAGKLRSSIESRKSDIHVKYTCNDAVASAGGYLHGILPATFWEADKKTARIDIEANVKPYTLAAYGKRAAKITIKTPMSTIEVNTDRQSDKNIKKNYLKFDITKTNNADNKLLTFLKFNYDVDRTPVANGVEYMHSANLTIPRYSWQLDADRKLTTEYRNRTFVLRREKMVPKNPSDANMVAWWTPQSASKFTPESWEITFRLDLQNRSRPATGETDHHKWLADAELIYPRAGTKHTIKANGKFSSDVNSKKGDKSCTADYVWESSYLQFRKQTYFNVVRTKTGFTIDANSTLTHMPSKRDATYTLYLDRQGRMFGPQTVPYKLTMKQDLKSRIVNFHQELETIQRPERKVNPDSLIPQNMLVTLNITSKSDVWDALNLDLDQYWNFDTNNGDEKMTMRHKYLDIDVVGSWEKPIREKGYHKEVKIVGKGSILPSRNIKMDWNGVESNVQVEYPQTKRLVNYKRTVNPEKTEAHLIATTNTQDQQPQLVVDYLVRLDNPTHTTRVVKVNPRLMSMGMAALAERYSKLFELYMSIRSDPNHPLNKALSPYLNGGSIAAHVEARRQFWSDNFAKLSETVTAIAQTQKPLIEPTAELFTNIISAYLNARRSAYDAFYTHTYTGSAISNTEWRQKYREIVHKYMNRLIAAYPSDKSTGIISNTVKWDHPEFTWERFDTMPKLTGRAYSRRFADMFMPLRKNTPVRRLPRFGAVYGNGNVVTFSGKCYDVSKNIGNECYYLLGHDFVYHRFSLVASHNAIHVLTPEVSATLARTGKVFLNGSTTPAEMPFIMGHTRVSRTGNDFEVSVGSGDVTAMCNPVYGYCWIQTDRWRHNRTLGLLGNNDYQQYNDFKLPNGDLAKDINQLMTTYELSGKAECKGRIQNKLECKSAPSDLCSKVFTESSSPLARAFEIIDPAPYMEACIQDTKCGLGPCGAIRTYVSFANIHLRSPVNPPNDCVYDVCGEGHGLDQSWTEQVGKDADVIFVVQQNVNLGKANVANHVTSVAKSVESTLKGKGYKNVNFGLVGYGGMGHRHNPYIYTSSGKVLASAQELTDSALKNFKFDCVRPTAPEVAVPKLKSYPHNSNAAKVYVIIGFNHQGAVVPPAKDDDGHYLYLSQLSDNYILQTYLNQGDSSVPKGVVDADNIVANIEQQSGSFRRCSCDFHNDKLGVECSPY